MGFGLGWVLDFGLLEGFLGLVWCGGFACFSFVFVRFCSVWFWVCFVGFLVCLGFGWLGLGFVVLRFFCWGGGFLLWFCFVGGMFVFFPSQIQKMLKTLNLMLC